MSITKKIWNDRNGNFGIMTALLLVPLIGVAGLAIDFSQALLLHSQYQAAADATAIGAITQKSDAFAQAMAIPDTEYYMNITEGDGIFKSQLSSDIINLPHSVGIGLKKSSSVITSTVYYDVRMPTTLLNIIGIPSLLIGGTATATFQTPSFLDIYMLLDNSPSMGLGSTTADMALMKTATQHASYRPSCAFACHTVSASGVEDPTDHYHLDRAAGATLRLDVVTQAVSDTVTKLKDIQIANGQVRMTAFSLGTAAAIPTPTPLKLINQTTDLDAFATAAENIQLMTVPDQTYGYGQTDYNQALQAVNTAITSVGTGADSNSRIPYVVIVGDGLTDNQNTPLASCTGVVSSGRCMEPIRTSYCDALKQRGIKVAVLYTTYVPVPEDGGWNTFIAPYYNKISANMQACATTGYYMEVSPTQDMGDAMNSIFGSIVAPPRLTK